HHVLRSWFASLAQGKSNAQDRCSIVILFWKIAGPRDDRRHLRMSARCRFRSIARGRAISVTPRSREYFGDFGAAAVGLSTGVALDIIGSDGGRRFAPFAVRAISHGCQPIHSWIAQPRHQDRSLCSLLLGSRRI